MFVALTISLSAIVLNVTARNAISELSKNLKVSVYFNDDSSASDQQKVRDAVLENEYVSSVEFISKEEAQKRFAASFQEDDKLLEGLALIGGDSLPASIEISVNNVEKIEEVGAIAEREEFKATVESVTLGKTDVKKTIDRAGSAQRFIIRASIVTAGIFAAVSVLIIFNTIRMAIFTRSEEIKIMKLIGATPNYIRGPFVIEACLYGIIAGIAANAAVYAAIWSVGSKVATQAEFQETYVYFTQTSTMLTMVVGAVLAGVLVGMLSSMLAMEKYLKLKNW